MAKTKTDFLNLLVGGLITACKEYNWMTNFYTPESAEGQYFKGKVDFAVKLLEEAGYAPQLVTRVKWLKSCEKDVKVYDFLKFPANWVEFSRLGIFESNNFDGSIYMFYGDEAMVVERCEDNGDVSKRSD